ncbi:response regulator [bacterium]|nr:response regulator [bacterium]
MGPDKGLDFIRAALANGSRTRFILMSGQKDPTVEREALTMGVQQCIDKNDTTTGILVAAIQAALNSR